MRKKVVWLPYDFDTAIGINNEGSLAFGYDLEDTDQTESGADVYNGQQSVVWKNLRDAFRPEIAAMYRTLRSQGKLSYEAVEKAFEDHQEKWPEAIFNEDAWYKYILPLIDDGTGAYLAMLQGSKAEQRKWWLYNRFRYIDSKYNAGDALSDVIQLRGYAKANITVRPYADIYPSVKYGSYLVQERGHRGQETTLVCPLDSVNDTEIYIYSASQLASVGDLSGLLVGFADFSMATRLQELKIGDSTSGYTNGNLTALTLGNNTLLKKIDVQNCTALTQTVDISGCTNIEEVYFDGSAVTGVTLPNGGVLKKLHLPGTITNLTIMNQTGIQELVAPVTNLTTLRIENVLGIDTKAILNAIPASTRVRLIGIAWQASNATEITNLYDTLDQMRGLDEFGHNVEKAQVSGSIHAPQLTSAQIRSYHERYPYITVTADVVKLSIFYYNWDGSELLYTEEKDKGQSGTYSGSPSRSATAQYTFTFAGWASTMDAEADDGSRNNIQDDVTVYAAYSRVLKTYTITWKNLDGTTLETDTGVPYGTMPTYDGATPMDDGEAATGWVPPVSVVTGDTTYKAEYIRNTTRNLIKRNIISAQNSIATSIIKQAFQGCYSLTSVDLPNVTSIGESAFDGCNALTSVDLPNVTSIERLGFGYCRNLTSVNLPKVASLGNQAFRNCDILMSLDFPKVTSIAYNALSYCSNLTTLILRANQVATLDESLGYSFSANIYVPDDLVDSYKAARYWSSYASRIKGISELPTSE